MVIGHGEEVQFVSGERINGQASGGQMGRVGDGEVELSLVEEEEGVKLNFSEVIGNGVPGPQLLFTQV